MACRTIISQAEKRAEFALYQEKLDQAGQRYFIRIPDRTGGLTHVRRPEWFGPDYIGVEGLSVEGFGLFSAIVPIYREGWHRVADLEAVKFCFFTLQGDQGFFFSYFFPGVDGAGEGDDI